MTWRKYEKQPSLKGSSSSYHLCTILELQNWIQSVKALTHRIKRYQEGWGQFVYAPNNRTQGMNQKCTYRKRKASVWRGHPSIFKFQQNILLLLSNHSFDKFPSEREILFSFKWKGILDESQNQYEDFWTLLNFRMREKSLNGNWWKYKSLIVNIEGVQDGWAYIVSF